MYKPRYEIDGNELTGEKLTRDNEPKRIEILQTMNEGNEGSDPTNPTGQNKSWSSKSEDSSIIREQHAQKRSPVTNLPSTAFVEGML